MSERIKYGRREIGITAARGVIGFMATVLVMNHGAYVDATRRNAHLDATARIPDPAPPTPADVIVDSAVQLNTLYEAQRMFRDDDGIYIPNPLGRDAQKESPNTTLREVLTERRHQIRAMSSIEDAIKDIETSPPLLTAVAGYKQSKDEHKATLEKTRELRAAEVARLESAAGLNPLTSVGTHLLAPIGMALLYAVAALPIQLKRPSFPFRERATEDVPATSQG